jgi:hypothetical protein
MFVMVKLQLDPKTKGAIQATWAGFTAWWLPGWKGVFTSNFLVDLIRSAIVAFLILGLGELYRRIPKSLDLRRAKRFWGAGIDGDGIALCFGGLIDSRVPNPQGPPQARYIKPFRDGRRQEIAGPSDRIIGLCEVRAASYLINALAKYRRIPLGIEDDQACLKRLDRSIVSLGSSASNEITEIIEQDPRNQFLRIESKDSSAAIRCKVTDSIVPVDAGEVRKDHGIILKLHNKRFPGQYFFVCAGIGEWGTSGAAWFLATHWKVLDSLGEEFGCVVEVEIGSDQSARFIYNPVAASSQHPSLDSKAPSKGP